MNKLTALVVFLALAGPTFAMCPLPPIPPIGCEVGPCICDAYGRNCRYVFICR